MSEKLKILTDKIYEEGVYKAKQESERVLKQAADEAARIRAEARREKEAILAEAESEAQARRRKTEAELRMAARKASSKLQEQLRSIITEQVIEKPLKKSLADPNVMAATLEACMNALNKSESGNWQIALSPEKIEEVKAAMKSGVQDALKSKLIIAANTEPGSGFEVIPEGRGFSIRFDENFFLDYFSNFLSVETRDWIASGQDA